MLDRIISPLCVCCQKEVLNPVCGLCPECFNSLFKLKNAVRCAYCSFPVNEGSNICGKCFSEKNFFDYSFFLFPYDNCGKALVQSVKFKDRIEFLSVVDYFEKEISQFVEKASPDCITYIPSSLFHFLKRGYTVPARLGKLLSLKYSIPFKKLIYAKKAYKKSLFKADSPSERREIVKGFFKVKSGERFGSVLVVDDVFTTGTTVNAVSRLLKRKKVAEKVWVFTLARVVKK